MAGLCSRPVLSTCLSTLLPHPSACFLSSTTLSPSALSLTGCLSSDSLWHSWEKSSQNKVGGHPSHRRQHLQLIANWQERARGKVAQWQRSCDCWWECCSCHQSIFACGDLQRWTVGSNLVLYVRNQWEQVSNVFKHRGRRGQLELEKAHFVDCLYRYELCDLLFFFFG